MFAQVRNLQTKYRAKGKQLSHTKVKINKYDDDDDDDNLKDSM